ncbi:MAG: OmpA family protein [Bradymonadia bacterium]
MKALLFLLVSTLLGGCVSGAALRARGDTLEDQLKRIRKPAYKCAQRELAMADAHLAFARVELQQGTYLKARDHMDVAVDFGRQAEVAAAQVGCRNADRDGDGIFDDVDLCPDQPEDKDGVEDADGCPEDQDSDGDGIADSKDQCPKQPEDFDGVADQDGCPDITEDKDGDGIGDAVDRCPVQAEDKDGFEDTDGCPDTDNDKDGLLDVADKCPVEPEDKDGFEDADGCPDIDNDKDRILDVVDQCPDQPEDYDNDADEDGCPDIYKTIVVTGDRIELKQKVFFSSNKSRILGRSFPLLNEVALAMKDNAALRVRIEGHTDSKGSARYNKRLSQKRADAVRRYLIGQGINGDRMEALGVGEEVPIEDNRTADGRAANRRVEFHIIGQ